MNAQQAHFKLNCGFIAQESIGYRREFLFAISQLAFQQDFVLRQIEGKIAISRTSEGLLAQGVFQALIDSVCVRCLENFSQMLHTDFTELFVFPSHATEKTELIFPEDGQIDFSPIVAEYMMLEVPINPICKVSCQGLCPICGNNLNTGPCQHDLEDIDPRLEVLKKLLDNV